MTTRSTSPIYAAIATAAVAAVLLVVSLDSAEAGKRGGGGGARDHRRSVGKTLQCQGHCADRHVRDQVAPRGKNKAGPNPVVRDHRGPNGVRNVTVTSQPRKPTGDLCAGWGC